MYSRETEIDATKINILSLTLGAHIPQKNSRIESGALCVLTCNAYKSYQIQTNPCNSLLLLRKTPSQLPFTKPCKSLEFLANPCHSFPVITSPSKSFQSSSILHVCLRVLTDPRECLQTRTSPSKSVCILTNPCQVLKSLRILAKSLQIITNLCISIRILPFLFKSSPLL